MSMSWCSVRQREEREREREREVEREKESKRESSGRTYMAWYRCIHIYNIYLYKCLGSVNKHTDTLMQIHICVCVVNA